MTKGLAIILSGFVSQFWLFYISTCSCSCSCLFYLHSRHYWPVKPSSVQQSGCYCDEAFTLSVQMLESVLHTLNLTLFFILDTISVVCLSGEGWKWEKVCRKSWINTRCVGTGRWRKSKRGESRGGKRQRKALKERKWRRKSQKGEEGRTEQHW